MGRVIALWCRFCKRTTHHERLDSDGSLRLMECSKCFAKNVQEVGVDAQ